ncbi:anthranilate phosphoribosyltransferase, partial [Amycolatopsis mediterranei]
AQPGAALIGCAYADKTRVLAETFARRGTRALVVRGDDGLDEITTTTTSTVWVVSEGTVTERSFDPASVGIARATAEDLRGGDAAANAEVVRDLVGGKPGPVRDAVLVNAAAALTAFTGFSESLEDDLRAGLARAAEAIDSGAAAALLDRWIAFS